MYIGNLLTKGRIDDLGDKRGTVRVVGSETVLKCPRKDPDDPPSAYEGTRLSQASLIGNPRTT